MERTIEVSELLSAREIEVDGEVRCPDCGGLLRFVNGNLQCTSCVAVFEPEWIEDD